MSKLVIGSLLGLLLAAVCFVMSPAAPADYVCTVTATDANGQQTVYSIPPGESEEVNCKTYTCQQTGNSIAPVVTSTKCRKENGVCVGVDVEDTYYCKAARCKSDGTFEILNNDVCWYNGQCVQKEPFQDVIVNQETKSCKCKDGATNLITCQA